VLRRILDSPWLYFGLAGVLLVIAVLSQFEIRTPDRDTGAPEEISRLRERDDVNVIWILIDTLRADRLGSYGYERPTSPFLDYLAENGIRFERCMSQSSWTKSSMASLWTGTFPGSNGILRWSHGIPEAAAMPAEILRDAGFRTGGIYRNGWVSPNFGFEQGFQIYYRPTPGRTPENFARRTPSSSPLMGTDQDVTESAIEFLRSHGHERFFLYLHYMDVHQYAYDQESARFGMGYADVYDNALLWTDRNIGALIVSLEEMGLAKKTMLVISSDHGEGFREHGQEGHGKTLYGEVVDVPLIISLPFRLDPGLVVRTPVQNVDVWPTILDLLGASPLAGAEGRSLVPLIEAAARGDESAVPGLGPDRPLFAKMDRRWGQTQGKPRYLVQVSRGPYRLIRPDRGDADGEEAEPEASEPAARERPMRVELFDKSVDPREQKNLFEERPEVAAELEALIDAHLESARVPWGDPKEVELDRMRLDQLRALGYVIQ
jgi:arylsulfatase A-like enzyme